MHPERDKILIDIKRKIREGKTSYDIAEFIKSHYNLSKQNIVFLTREANELIKREQDFTIRDIMIEHAALYEKIWEKNFRTPLSKKLDNPESDMNDQDVRNTLHKIANHFETAAEALENKEKMLGIVHNRMDVQLKNELSEQEKKNEPQFDDSKFDPSKLSLSENLELLALLKKAKGEEDEALVKITTKVTISQNEAKEEIKYEEVIDKFDIETVDYEEVKDIPAQLRIEQINQSIQDNEAKKLEENLSKKRKELQKSHKAKLKEKLLAKYRNK